MHNAQTLLLKTMLHRRMLLHPQTTPHARRPVRRGGGDAVCACRHRGGGHLYVDVNNRHLNTGSWILRGHTGHVDNSVMQKRITGLQEVCSARLASLLLVLLIISLFYFIYTENDNRQQQTNKVKGLCSSVEHASRLGKQSPVIADAWHY